MYIVLKKMQVGNTQYFPGNAVDERNLSTYGLKYLEKRGFLVKAENAGNLPNIIVETKVKVPLGDADTELSGDEIRQIFSILQMSNADAQNAISETDDANVLNAVSVLDSRKAIKKIINNIGEDVE